MDNMNLDFITYGELRFMYLELDPQMTFEEFIETYEPVKVDEDGIYVTIKDDMEEWWETTGVYLVEPYYGGENVWED